MKLRELIKELETYNQDAKVDVMAHNKGYAFTIAYGTNEGVTKKTAESVSFYVDELMNEETACKSKASDR